ncbi:uncharacterized protein TNCV_289221 [Trichonephila clavipes]|nr:uncharacterized protein TNCV_289221 [Trichonephila clavipes]
MVEDDGRSGRPQTSHTAENFEKVSESISSVKIGIPSFQERNMDLYLLNSSTVSKNASVCSDQPQATQIGIDILKKGGNAADAAVATMAAVSVLEPLACGIGGDCHCTFYRKKDKAVLSINGRDIRTSTTLATGNYYPYNVVWKFKKLSARGHPHHLAVIYSYEARQQ